MQKIETKSPVVRNITYVEAMFLIFLTLKLIHKINWPWWQVTAPLWASWGTSLGILFIIAFIKMWKTMK